MLFTLPNVLSTSTRNPHGVKDNYIPTITEQNPQYLVFGFEGIHLLQTLMRTFPFLFNRISGNCRNLLLPLRSLLIGKPLLCRGGGHNGYHHTVQLSYLKSIFFQSTTELGRIFHLTLKGGRCHSATHTGRSVPSFPLSEYLENIARHGKLETSNEMSLYK
ncbi:predicted protein [Lodderomyces elongisporus NRRL YB-4239]|uniref:Uncharacterized protein n=1 Tax=Lodderomyces elongisporus (strain ATCC 11503 / CBS 2605 / JCM 1781 / NBRC 1676 / NRRL YB-4239) TaxID=379508 RepID=A5E7P4_LODEL|nr:predicted protein [Lodderomyces elongisporus NRRL YB-4239]